jgi:hypothetical protein
MPTSEVVLIELLAPMKGRATMKLPSPEAVRPALESKSRTAPAAKRAAFPANVLDVSRRVGRKMIHRHGRGWNGSEPDAQCCSRDGVLERHFSLVVGAQAFAMPRQAGNVAAV